jgi:hypothetical protein
MDSHDVRDPDGVIDEVARAMTSTELTRDLRPAVASRIASPSSRAFGWRAGVAAAAVAAVVVAAVVLRPSPESQRPQTVAGAGAERATVATPVDSSGSETALAATESQARRRTGRPVARQTIVDTEIAEIVDISPVAIVPLEGDDGDTVLTSSHVVEIAPIDVEPVSISGLELVE